VFFELNNQVCTNSNLTHVKKLIKINKYVKRILIYFSVSFKWRAFIHNLDLGICIPLVFLFIHMLFSAGHIFHIWIRIFVILTSLDSSWQALRNGKLAPTFGDCDMGSPETNFLFWDLFHIKSQNLRSFTYDACFRCRFHHCFCDEGGYHFRRFQLDWERAISHPFI
jgi:hypothetical protein